MATVGSRNLTLIDVAKRKDPDGKVANIVEVLNEDHEVFEDAVFKECNDGTNNKTTTRTGIPGGTWRKLYGGIQSSKSETTQVVDSCGMLEQLPKIDVDVVDKSTDPKGTLLSEHVPHIEGMKQDVEQTLFYGDTAVYPERFMGLAPRYDSYERSTPDKDYSDYNVINGGGSGSDNTSVWLITWSDNHTHFIYPQGSKAGLTQTNMGKKLTTAYDSDGKPAGDYLAYVSHYKWDIGLCVRDWRGNGRICNVDVSDLEDEEAAATDLVKKMIHLSERVRGNGKKAWYMNPRVRTMLRIQMLGKANVNLTFETVEGRKVMFFDDIPVRVSWKLLLTESALSQAS